MGKKGFTIVELLIVVVVIAILASITIVAYNGIQAQARESKINADLATLEKAILAAREQAGSNLFTILGTGTTEAGCWTKPSGTNFATLPTSDVCWVSYTNALNAISVASGINVRQLADPWGRPYLVNANEGENQTTHLCMNDRIGVYSQPFVTGTTQVNRPVVLWSSTCP